MNEVELQKAFSLFFKEPPQEIFSAPGRVNLIGEHTDYNLGFVFPVAIDFGTSIAVSKRDDYLISVVSLDYDNEHISFSITDEAVFDSNATWSNYIRGIVHVLKNKVNLTRGLNMVLTGNVPQGAGLSSSASFEIATLKAFQEVYQLGIDGVGAALIGQQAENEFVGCACGIMDQLISALGETNKAMLLDCREITHKSTLIPENLKILIINSNVKRGLVDSEYNLRREQCEEAARAMQVASLRDADIELLNRKKGHMSELCYKRALHVISENDRTLQMFDALSIEDTVSISRLMAESHRSMRDDFQITVWQIDLLVELVSEKLGDDGGVRMTGGGFGGCVVALVPECKIDEIIEKVGPEYTKKTEIEPDFYVCKAISGAFS